MASYILKQYNNSNITSNTISLPIPEGQSADDWVLCKLGYCCEPKGVNKTLLLNNDIITIGKYGIYEISENKLAGIETITVPDGIQFTLELGLRKKE